MMAQPSRHQNLPRHELDAVSGARILRLSREASKLDKCAPIGTRSTVRVELKHEWNILCAGHLTSHVSI